MSIVAQDFITDYPQTAAQVLAEFAQLAPKVQQQLETANTMEYWCKQACQIGLGIIASTPPQFSNSGATLMRDTWDWIPPDVREQMAQQDHVYYQAWQAAQGE